jgi:hypothetical protein
MQTETLHLIQQIVQSAAASNNALIAIICLIIGGISYVVFKNVIALGKVPLFISFVMFLATTVFVVLALQNSIQEPKRIYYVGSGNPDISGSDPRSTVLKVGVFVKESADRWSETSLRSEDPYAYRFTRSYTENEILYLVDTDRNVTVRIDPLNKVIFCYWKTGNGNSPLTYLYPILVIM